MTCRTPLCGSAEHGLHEPNTTRCSPSFWLGLLCIIVGATAVCNVGNLHAIYVLSAVTIAIMIIARMPLTRLRNLLPLFSFGIFTFLLLLIVPVDPDAEMLRLPLWGREVPADGAWFLLSLMVKSALIVMQVTAFAGRIRERDMLEGLTGLLLPARLVSLCYLMVRGVSSIGGEVRRLIHARDARGQARGFRAAKVVMAMTQVLLVRLGRRAETQAFALCARGYNGRLALSQCRGISTTEIAFLIFCTAGFVWLTLL